MLLLCSPDSAARIVHFRTWIIIICCRRSRTGKSRSCDVYLFFSPRPPPFISAGSVSVDSDRFGSFQFSALRFIRFPAFFSGRKVKKRCYPPKKVFQYCFRVAPFWSFSCPSPNIWTWCHLCRKRGEGDDKNFPFCFPTPQNLFWHWVIVQEGNVPFFSTFTVPTKWKAFDHNRSNFICAFCTYVCKAPTPKNIACVDNFVRFPKKHPKSAVRLGFSPPLPFSVWVTSCPSVQWASVFLGSFGLATKTVWTKVYGALCHRDEPTPPLSSLLDQRMAHRPLSPRKKEKKHTWKKRRKRGSN